LIDEEYELKGFQWERRSKFSFPIARQFPTGKKTNGFTSAGKEQIDLTRTREIKECIRGEGGLPVFTKGGGRKFESSPDHNEAEA